MSPNEFVAMTFAALAFVNPFPPANDPAHEPPMLSLEKHEVGSASLNWKRQRVACKRLHWDNTKMVAAHRSLPCGSKVIVTNIDRYLDVEVTIVDRGPYVKGRIIDISPAAGAQIGLTKRQGVARNVRITW